MRIQCLSLHAAAGDAFAAEGTLLVVGVYANEWSMSDALKDAGFDQDIWLPAVALAKAEGFVGGAKQQFVLRLMGNKGGASRGATLALLGLGARKDMTQNAWLRIAGRAMRLAKGQHKTRLTLCLPCLIEATEAPLQDVLLVAQGLCLGLYRFVACKGEPSKKDAKNSKDPATLGQPPKEATLWLGGSSAEALSECDEATEVGRVVAEAVARARDWVNLPANLLGPTELANKAVAEAKHTGMDVQVLDERALAKHGMGLLLGVGQGSERPPRLVHLTYDGPGATAVAPIVLIGKGIVFDSGGLCIKPCESMSTMKMDMGGAACVLAVLGAIARLELPVRVHGLLALAENMPSGHAIRPGDVLTSMAGKTIEVNNTDAEGRLVLADAITYAKALKPHAMVDVATLTGASMVALGTTTSALFANDDALASEIGQAARAAGEDMWRMPLTRALRDQLKSECADMRNTGDRYGGAITAALFLQEFVGDELWAHLDIAGPAWGGEDDGHMTKGGTGAAVATLVRWLMQCSQKEGSPVRGVPSEGVAAASSEPRAATGAARPRRSKAAKRSTPRRRGRGG